MEEIVSAYPVVVFDLDGTLLPMSSLHRVGLSIALNATPDARDAALQALNTNDLRDLLPLLQPAQSGLTADRLGSSENPGDG
jgi:phosphoserine phosphatase